MAASVEAAEALKEQANAAFQACKFGDAVSLYSQAIQANGNNAVYWANRAFAHTKLEEYGSAIQDATRAVELNPKYVKGYYRRGAAFMALGKFKDGLKDFRQVCKIAPKDPDAMKKLRECEKAVQRKQFEDAICSDGPQRSVVDSIHLDMIEVHPSHEGARIPETGIDLPFLKQMMDDFKNGKQLHRKYAFQILLKMREELYKLPTLVEIDVPEGRHFTVCGDVHGQYFDLMNIFELNGLPSDENPYLFNGDFVDRGSFSVECILTLFAFKCLYPTALYLARGNHESKGMNRIYGFYGEVRSKFTETMASLFSEVFCGLPLAHVINKKILVVHGGLFSNDFVRLSDINEIDRFQEPPDEGLMCEILWSDPQPEPGRAPSKRGVGVAFGPDVSQKFLQLNKLDLLIRSHEMKEQGYEVAHNGKVITIFSAPNYCDQMGNMGAFVKFQSPALKPEFTSYPAVPHPPIKPMAYASNFGGLLF